MEAKTLALYLGCQFRYRYVDWEKDSWSPFTMLNGRNIDKMQDLSIDKIQLLLRPLSSMTEEESKTYRELHDKLFEDGCLNGEAWAQLTIHLLSKGFDLFGLIEKGEALDATKQ